MSIEGKRKVGDTIAFILAKNNDCEQIAKSLDALGYGEVIDPAAVSAMHGGRRRNKDRREVVLHDIRLLAGAHVIVMGPECELLPWAVAVAATAGTMGVDFERIEVLDPDWRKA